MGLRSLRKRISNITGWMDGIVGVCVHDVGAGEETGVREDELFALASVCKTPILVHAYRMADAGTLSLDDRVELNDAARIGGSGLIRYFDDGATFSLRDLLTMMIAVSDNAATDMVLAKCGGPAAVTETMQALGLPAITLHRTIRELLDDINTAIHPGARGLSPEALNEFIKSTPEIDARFKDAEAVRRCITEVTSVQDVASPRAICRLYAQIARLECASAASCEAILQTLERQQLRGRLPRELPHGVRICSKTGTLGAGMVTNDSGVLFVGDHPICVTVLSREMAQEPAATNTGVARIGRAIYDHFAQAYRVSPEH